MTILGHPWWLKRERICFQCRRPGFDPWVGKIPWKREWQTTPVFLPGESHRQRSLEGYSPWGPTELDATKRLKPQALLRVIFQKLHYLFIFDCAGSSLLVRAFFSSCSKPGLLSSCGAQASGSTGFSCCGAQALGHAGFSSCSPQAPEHRFNSCGAWA